MRYVRALVIVFAACWVMLAGFAKAQDVHAFQEVLVKQGLLPLGMARGVSVLFPWLEIAIAGVSLWWAAMPETLSRAAGALAGVFGCFAVYITALWLRPPAEPVGCGCGFSNTPVQSWGVHAGVVWGAGIVLAGLAVTAGTRSVPALEASEPTPLEA